MMKIHINLNVQIVPFDKHVCYVMKTYNLQLLQGPANNRIKATIDSLDLPYNEYDDCYHWLEFRDFLIGDRGKE